MDDETEIDDLTARLELAEIKQCAHEMGMLIARRSAAVGVTALELLVAITLNGYAIPTEEFLKGVEGARKALARHG